MNGFRNISCAVYFALFAVLISGFQTMAQQCMSDSKGSALGIISNITYLSDKMPDLVLTMGKQAARSPQRVVKFLCADLGSQTAYAFAIQTVLRHHSENCNKTYNEGPIAGRITDLIKTLGDAKNKYCYGDIDARDAGKGIQEIQITARKHLDQLSNLLSPSTGKGATAPAGSASQTSTTQK